jgi:hypothetical protein
MKRLVYSPSINAWVKTDTGVFDLSPYVTDCTIDRRVNSVSFARLTFRNPKIPDPTNPKKQRFLFTEHVRDDGSIHPMLHPMDPIIITMTRLKGRPIQVFTGFCDTTPYIQLYPGTAQLTASCTLKRLQYTYWDPALPFVQEFMLANGWVITKSGTALNPSAEQRRRGAEGELSDSSIGFLLYQILQQVGGWDQSDIYIQGLPPKIGKLVARLYQDTAKEEAQSIKDFHDFLHDLVGASHYGSLGSTTLSGTTSNNNADVNLPEGDISGTKVFEGTRVAGWIAPILQYARQHGWTGQVTSGFRSYEKQKELWDNRANNSNPVAPPGTSNHEGSKFPRGAVDVDTASAEQLSQILLQSPYAATLVYAASKDPVHFSHPHDGSY